MIFKITNVPITMQGTAGTSIKIIPPETGNWFWAEGELRTGGIKDSHTYKFANITLDRNTRYIDLTNQRSFRFLVSVVELWQTSTSLILVLAKTDHPKTFPNSYTARIDSFILGIPLDKVEVLNLPEPGEPYMLIFEYFENEIRNGS